jgi:hypothetical protein
MSFCSTCNQHFKYENLAHSQTASHFKNKIKNLDTNGVKTEDEFVGYVSCCITLVNRSKKSVKMKFFYKILQLFEKYNYLMVGNKFEELLYITINKYEEAENPIFFDIAKLKLNYHLKTNLKINTELTFKFAYMNINRMIFEERGLSEDLQRLVDKFL